MKRWILLLTIALTGIPAIAGNGLMPMLVQGKTWAYVYHHFEDKYTDDPEASYEDLYEESRWMVYYTLRGDTVINGQTYMKLYRKDEKAMTEQYYGAFREDEEGCVWQYDYEGNKQDFRLVDVTFTYYPYSDVYEMPVSDVINVNGQLLHRYHRNGFTGVEGVGIEGKGLVHYLYEEVPTCICDFESFESVWGGNISYLFSASSFQAPKYIVLTDNEKQLVKQNNDFAFNLFRQARTESNQILSPLSITYALGMLNNGAAGQTQQEINQVLGFGEAGADAINQFCHKMQTEAQTLDKNTRVSIANSIYVNSFLGIELKEPFAQKAYDFYNATPESRDFYDGKTRDVINQWASDHTEGMIEELLKKDEFEEDAVSYLLNALYFKGMWSNPFKLEDTQEEPFNGGETVPMMHLPADEFSGGTEFVYTHNNLYQAVKLSYGNGAYLMTVILPQEGKTIGDVLDQMDGQNWKIQGEYTLVDLKLPRFETSIDLDLKPIMMALGMPSAFDSFSADFSEFCNTSTFISLMKQAAKIKVNEEGTEAAAVTVISMDEFGMPEYVKFHANRPFLYIISEQSTGIIFFIGQYTGVDIADAIQEPVIIDGQRTNVEGQGSIYNLNGQRLQSVPAHGIYIQNGVKRVVK